MKDILKELYYGNIQPDAKLYGQNSPFVQAARLKNQNFEKLMITLEDSEKELFYKYCDANGEIEDIMRFNTFTITGENSVPE